MDSSAAQHPVLDAEQQTDWYLAYTKPRAEDVGLDNLLRQGFEAWCPKIKKIPARRRAKADQALFTQEALFPRYVFVRPSHPGQSISSIRSTIGITNLVAFGIEPARLSHDRLVQIAHWVQQQQALGAAEVMGLEPGTPVRITQGPFAGLDALVSMTALDRVIVLLNLLGKAHELPLAYAAVTRT